MDRLTRRIRNILFDFDFTLADSSHGVLSCTNDALTRLGYPEATYESSCRTIGLSLKDTFTALTGGSAEEAAIFTRLFMEKAEEVMVDMTALFEETTGTIHSLKDAGYRLGIVSTKFKSRIESILQRDGLLALFDVIVGGENVTFHKPDPESLRLAMDRLEAVRENTLYVGDSIVDARTAENLGVPFIAVLSGVTPGEVFHGYPRVAILRSVQDLPGFLVNHGP
jgi:phosphoglycolate phosphatase